LVNTVLPPGVDSLSVPWRWVHWVEQLIEDGLTTLVVGYECHFFRFEKLDMLREGQKICPFLILPQPLAKCVGVAETLFKYFLKRPSFSPMTSRHLLEEKLELQHRDLSPSPPALQLTLLQTFLISYL
jgi:hypothetical protein